MTSPLSWQFILAAHAFGGTASQNLFVTIHQITHSLTFRGIAANELPANLSLACRTARGLRSTTLSTKYMGMDGIDTDIPTRFELLCLYSVAFFATFQILFYVLGPGFLAFNMLVYYLFGAKLLVYMVVSSFWAGSLHPCVAHFIAEHYLWDGLA
ncbi:hypothetical protein FIBSPDRAFT_965078 [Athelia psychrophila]|uniref:Uncharacterized protein n=1 Tax=Athelia psychrophila TaxID=1759441 RepID=A0A165X0L7_9AGAM|nr:hypothetical protein FIBSPDRAFT_965078 [Fibularhizoctonia sp. CBS 109695]